MSPARNIAPSDGVDEIVTARFELRHADLDHAPVNPFRRALLCSLLLLGAWQGLTPNGGAAKTLEPVTIGGEIERGRAFAASLSDKLEFQLRPIEHGWLIWVGDPAAPDDNYAAIMTPPFHGPNEMIIEGWHFRNSDNTGPNELGSKNINFPQERRQFYFAVARTDYELARDVLSTMLWPDGASESTIEAARVSWESIPAAVGELTITDLDLGHLVPGEQAWIERMAFTLTLRFP